MAGFAWLLWAIGAYFCGSVSFALLLGRLRGVDIRKAGSGNVGATNVGRLLGRRWGMLCFALDVLKGFVPVLAAGLALGYVGRWGAAGAASGSTATMLTATESWQWLAIGAAAVLGHVFPVWLAFKGGKGVATSFGVLLGYWPALTLPAAAALVTWLALLAMLRRISVASVGAAVALPIYVALAGAIGGVDLAAMVPWLVVTTALTLLVIVRHRGNIVRLLAGTEPKLGQKAQVGKMDGQMEDLANRTGAPPHH